MRLRDRRFYENGVRAYWLYFLGLPLVAFALASMTGLIWAMSLCGLLCIIFLRSFAKTSLRTDQYATSDLRRKGLPVNTPGISKFRSDMLLVLTVGSGIAKLISDIPVMIAERQVHPIASQAVTFDWKQAVMILAPMLLGVTARSQKATLENLEEAGRPALFLTSFTLATSSLILICGLWGPAAILAANRIVNSPSSDTLFGIPVLLPISVASPERQQAAFELCVRLGLVAYYVLFVLVPGYWLAQGVILWCWKKFKLAKLAKDPYLDMAINSLPPSGFGGLSLLAVAWFVGHRTGILSPVNPIDTKYYQCLYGEGQESYAKEVGCYDAATSDWQAEMQQQLQLLRQRLSNQPSKQALLEMDNRRWDSWQRDDLAQLTKKNAKNPNRELVLAQERLVTTRDHVVLLHSEILSSR